MTHPPTPPAAPPLPAPPPAKTRRWPKRLLIGFLVVANLGIFGALGAVWYVARQVTTAVANVPSEGLGVTDSPSDLGDPRTFLLIGSDSRADLPDDWGGDGDYGGQRADVRMLGEAGPA